MVHGGYDGGGQCLLQLFFFFPVQRTSHCCFFFLSASIWFFSFWSLVGVELLVAFRRCGGGCWPVELLWGATVALLLSMQRREPLFFFFFCCWSNTPFSVAALWQWWIGRPTVVLLFPSFFLCNFLSLRLLSIFFVFSFPVCLLSLSSPPLCFYFPPSLSRSLFYFSLFCCAVLVRLWWRMAVAAGRRRWWADDGVGSAGAALSPPLFFPLSFPSGFPSRFVFFFFLSVLLCSPQVISVFPPYIPLSLCLFSPPFFVLLFSSFIAKTACVFYNENVQNHYCSGNGREMVAVKRSHNLWHLLLKTVPVCWNGCFEDGDE